MHVGLGLGLTWGQGGGVFSPHHLYQSGDILLWYDPSDLTTMFTNTTGTTQVAADGDSVALMLDKGQWGGKTLEQVLAAQPELVTNGAFDADTNWSKSGDWSIASGVATHGGGTDGHILQSMCEDGKTYRVTFTVVSKTDGQLLGRTNNGGTTVFTHAAHAAGTFTYTFQSVGTSFGLRAENNASPIVIDNFSVKEIPGYHRVQATGTSMPKYKTGPNPAAAANSQALSLGAWATGQSTGTGTATPAGEQVTLVGTDGSNRGRSYRTFSATSGKTYAVEYTCTVTSGGGFVSFSASANAAGWGPEATVTLAAGTRTFLITASSTATGYINFATSLGGGNLAITINSVKEIPASAPYIHWLLYDGTDDGHATGTITWGTDEVAVCTGVTKSSDAAAGVLIELSSSSSGNLDSFGLIPPGSAAANYFWRSSTIGQVTVTPFAAPCTDVLSGAGKRSTDLCTLRVSGVAAGSSAADQGTGNFGSYPLYFGRRGGSTLPFNGREYQTVIRSRLLSAVELASLETFIAAKTGVIL